MTVSLRLAAISLDCADPAELAEFYSRLTGFEVVFGNDDFVALRGDIYLTLQRVEGYRPPTWPEGERAKQIHLDFATDDLDGAQQIAVGLGASVADAQPSPERWRVLIDPAGHPFCFTTLIPGRA
jgi:catechol 2,3-dioxygenase-like lactoylglutathione lyase family enzyme